jgi:hypothetical protein
MANAPQQTPAQINATVIGSLLGSPNIRHYIKKIGSFVGTPGNEVQVLPNKTGFITGFFVKATATVNNAGAAAVNALPEACLKLVQRVTYAGFSGSTRHDTSLIEMVNLLNLRTGGTLGQSLTSNVPMSKNTNVIANPSSVPATGTAAVEFWFYVPIADPKSNSLMGIEFAQYQKAQASLNLTVATDTQASTNDPFVGMYDGAVTLTGVNFDVYQAYFSGALLQANGAVVLPPESTAVSYSIISGQVPNTLVAGQISRDFLDQNYQYLSYGLMYNDGAAFNGSSVLSGTKDVDKIGLYVDTDTPVHEYDPALLMINNRAMLRDGNTMDGFYMLDLYNRPIQSSQYGQYNIGFTPLSVAAGAYVRRTLEVYRSI